MEVFDASTGEVHADARTFFLSHPLLYQPETHEDRAFHLCADELTILTVVGAADGRFDPDEQDQLLVHVFDRYLDGPLEEDVVRRQLALMTPDEAAFQTSLKRIASGSRGDARMLTRTLRRVIEADGVLDPAELAFVSAIQAEL